MRVRLIIFLVFTIVMVSVMQWQGAALKTPVSDCGILDLEFAFTSERLHQLMGAWDLGAVRTNIYLDFLLIIAYSGLFYMLCKLVGERWKPGFASGTGLFFSLASLFAGLLDAAENACMLIALASPESVAIRAAYYFAIIKFALIALIILYILLSLPFVLRKRSRN
jgi:hypothetical protein